MGINDILNIARAGLAVNQSAIKVTGENVSNVNTEGYSRRRMDISTVGGSGLVNGAGQAVADIRRVHDDFLTRQVNMQLGSFSFLEGRQMVAQQMEAILPELDNQGINNALSEFFGSWSSLANNPSDVSQRRNVLYEAQNLADRINQAYSDMTDLQKGFDQDIKAHIEMANSLLSDLAGLNKSIGSLEDPSGSSDAAALLDQRDEVIRQLNGLLDISTFTGKDGNIGVMLANHVILQGSSAGSLSAEPGDQIGVTLETLGGHSIDITAKLATDGGKGKLAGIIYERDTFIEDMKGRLDELAFNLAEQVNTIHSASFGLDGVDGRDFFTAIADVDGAAELLQVDSAILGDTNLIAAASDGTAGPGDNRGALAIYDLMNDPATMGGVSFLEYHIETMGLVSNRLARLDNDLQVQETSLYQAENYRTSVAGVSIDEEMVSLIQFQSAFDASAKMITTIDEMLQTLISLKA